MKRSTRKLIFLGFFLFFLIITPGVILYATGYSFDWENRHFFKTGSLFLRSLPSGAQIKIDGELSGKTPAYINRLNPDPYQIEVSKNGFFTWQKKLIVQEQITTEARNILLVPQKPLTRLANTNVTSTKEYFLTQQEKDAQKQAIMVASSTIRDFLSFSVYKNNIYYIQNSNLVLYRTDLSGNGKEQISLQSLPKPAKSYEITISPEQIAVFEPGGQLFILDKQTKTFNPLADEIQGIEFSSDNQKILFWSEHEIWVLWLKDAWVQPYRKTGENELLTRYSDKITQAVWVTKTNEHIIYSAAGPDGQAQIKITELDGREQRNTFNLYSAQNPEIYWNKNEDLLYILIDNSLFSLSLINS
ncbi:MAG: hypothetical protein A2Y98_00025 [Candidatus Portnoybacteria bacterium RBG_19FT_COMBO_36_7]|uniref:PEGA domain-containing protein n=1 Tax=Candidatus Portnoybacteria bacterium RBG_19FT_COMBO_36_7 TaxID=1801992 RepID=A0A1G2F995_9BACT|nr:MAG: hypothetical protein A2Y98_00025 [Candidatus Portnoybacteria bacterium RBG_19FT_COMBO_36_7]